MSSTSFLIISSISIFFLLANASNAPSKPSGFYIPIKKDPKSHLYYTDVAMGTPALSKGLVIDLGGRTTWINCDTYVSSSYRPIMCLSAECKSLNTSFCSQCDGPPRKNCSSVITCGTDTWNPVKGIYIRAKELGYDTIHVYSTEYSHLYDVPHFIFSCSDSFLSEDLPKDTSGILGLGRTKVSLSTQLADKFGLPNKFALCIPSSSKKGYGDLIIGGGPYYMPPQKEDLSKSLIKTPLIVNHRHSGIPLITDPQDEYEYFVDVKSITVDGKLVPFNTSLLVIDGGVGGTKISTVDRYTILHTSIYEAVISEFVKAAMHRNITRISSVKPFGACFSSSTIASSKTGPIVPTIDLVFKSGNGYWRVYGANSMVRLNKDAMCLGIADGGLNASPSIVVGGNWLEDNLLEFDLGSSELGFTNALSLYDTSCSHIRV